MILAAAPAAPAAGVAGISAGLLLLLFALIVLYGLQAGYQYTFGAFIRKLADAVEDIWIVGDDLADALDRLDSWVMKQIGNGINGVEVAVGVLWAGLTTVVRETGDAVAAFGADVHDAIAGVIYGEIPAQVGARTRPLRQELTGTRSGLDARLDAEAKARSRGIDATKRDLAAESRARLRGIDDLRTWVGRHVLARVRGIEATLGSAVLPRIRGLAGRLGSVEELLAAGLLGATAIAALTRVYPWWQCTNVRAFNRALCRAPIGALDDLLGLALLALGPVSIVELARALQGVTDEAADGVHFFVR